MEKLGISISRLLKGGVVKNECCLDIFFTERFLEIKRKEFEIPIILKEIK